MPVTPDVSRLSDLLACPRCDKAPLTRKSDSWRCDGCKTGFPSVGGIPWLFADPGASLSEWRNRLHFELQRLAHDAQQLKSELDAGDLLPQTRKRLELQLQASVGHRKALQRLLTPIDVQSMQASYESHLALRTRLPRDQGLNTYYANAHRDWAWGEAENEASLIEIRGALNARGDRGEELGNTLVLGAGAGRLAYDVHTTCNADLTVALDFNPLLLLIAKAVTQGEPLELHEFPIAPKSIDDFAVLRKLAAPASLGDNFYFVLGDVLRAPFRPGGFDTVVTPWLIDIVSEDLQPLALRINRLLKIGGRWVNFGSLAFEHAERARRYGPEETISIVQQSGFAAPYVREETIPYMCSPASRHGRRETVFTFAAVKASDALPSPRHRALPDWIVTGSEPVPLTRSFRTQALSTQIYSYIMSLIDGRRSIADMAKILEQQKLMTEAEAVPAIRNFLTRMYDDSQRQA
ncbi:MAG: methyltransferase domain-containing protein [Woeseia sp.]